MRFTVLEDSFGGGIIFDGERKRDLSVGDGRICHL